MISFSLKSLELGRVALIFSDELHPVNKIIDDMKHNRAFFCGSDRFSQFEIEVIEPIRQYFKDDPRIIKKIKIIVKINKFI